MPKFDNTYWTDEQLVHLALALERSYGSYSGLGVMYGELLCELKNRKLLTIQPQAHKFGEWGDGWRPAHENAADRLNRNAT